MPPGADLPAPALYELVLNADDQPEADGTFAAFVEAGAEFTVRCVAEERFEQGGILLEKDQLSIPTTSKTTGRVELSVSSFDVLSHSGLYQCEATTTEGIVHSRQLRVSAKRESPQTDPCPPAERDKCGPNGVCGMLKNSPTCFCHFEYVGKHCDTRLITDFDSTSPISSLWNVYQVAAGASGTFSVVCCALIVLLGVLYFKERRRTKKLVDFYGPLPAPINVYGDLPENPYKYSDIRIPQENGELPKRGDSFRNAFRLQGGKRKEEIEEEKELRPKESIPSIS